MQEFPPSEDYFWMDTLARCKVTLPPFIQSKLTLHWSLNQELYMHRPTVQDMAQFLWHSFYTTNEILEYSKVLGMHQSACTHRTIQITWRTALIHPLSETHHVHIWDGYHFVKLSWNMVQSSKRWGVHGQWRSFHWPCLPQESNIEKQTNQPPKTHLARLKYSPRKDVIIMSLFVMDAEKREKMLCLCKIRDDPW